MHGMFHSLKCKKALGRVIDINGYMSCVHVSAYQHGICNRTIKLEG